MKFTVKYQYCNEFATIFIDQEYMPSFMTYLRIFILFQLPQPTIGFHLGSLNSLLCLYIPHILPQILFNPTVKHFRDHSAEVTTDTPTNFHTLKFYLPHLLYLTLRILKICKETSLLHFQGRISLRKVSAHSVTKQGRRCIRVFRLLFFMILYEKRPSILVIG